MSEIPKHSKYSLLEIVKLVNSNPNDQDLGREIRKKINELKSEDSLTGLFEIFESHKLLKK